MIKKISLIDDKFTDYLLIYDSLLKSVNKISEINKKITQIDDKSLNKISEIDKKILLIDNKFTDNMRFMIDSLLKSVNKISGINKKIT